MAKERHKVKKYGTQLSIQLPKQKTNLAEDDDVVVVRLGEFKKHMDEYEKLKQQIPADDIEKQNQILQDDLKHKNSEIAKLEEDVKVLERKLNESNELKIRQEYLNKDLERLRNENDNINRKLEVYEHQAEEYLTKDKELQTAVLKLDDLQEKLIDYERMSDDLEDKKAIIIENNTTIVNLQNYIQLMYNRGLISRILNQEPKQKTIKPIPADAKKVKH